MLYILAIVIFWLYVNYEIDKFADKVNPYNWMK